MTVLQHLSPSGPRRLRRNVQRGGLLLAMAGLLQVEPAAAALSPRGERHTSRGLEIAQSAGVTIRPSQGFAGQNSGAFFNFFDLLGGFAVPVPSLTPFGSSDEDDKKKKEEEEKKAAAAAAAATTQP